MSQLSTADSAGESIFHKPIRPTVKPTIIKILSPPLTTPVIESQDDPVSASIIPMTSAGPHNLQFKPSTPSPGYLREHEVYGNASGMMLFRTPSASEQPSTAGFTNEEMTPVSDSDSHSVRRRYGRDLDSESGISQLDADEVIELQSFLEKKTWLEDKIKALENAAHIDPFAGLPGDLNDSASNAGGEINDLPDRIQLQLWLSEQESIEAEMEEIDGGSLLRLKQFAKEKSREDLSSEDTDLIEVTLRTLVGFEKLTKLLHLRSERLEILRLRLLWEEQRMTAWKERDTILADLEAFVAKARWSTVAYIKARSDARSEVITLPDQTTPPASPHFHFQRLRTMSPSSTTPRSSPTVIPQSLFPSSNTDFSRSNRFRISDSLSREAASFANRVSEFKSRRVAAAATTLDKLIAVSREKVPDEILDEQDRLEVKSSVLDGLGRFGMNVAMQWIKCDSVYADLKRTQANSQQLREEIDKARSFHPTARLKDAFTGRLASLSSHLATIIDPSTSRSFPRPAHPAYPDQESSNDYITNVLSMELRYAKELVDAAQRASDAYRSSFRSVSQVDKLRGEMLNISERLSATTSKLTKGTVTREGDGSPVDISSESCLDPLRHMVYLASIPTLTWEIDDSDDAADRALTKCRTTMIDLQESGVPIDSKLKMGTEIAMSRLQSERIQAQKVLEEVSTKTGFLREARELWTSINEDLALLDRARRDLVSAAERQRWKPVTRDELGAPKLARASTEKGETTFGLKPADILTRVEELSVHNVSFIAPRQTALLPLLSTRLAEHIQTSSDALEKQITIMKEATKLWEDIIRQKAVMISVQEETLALSQRLSDIKRLLTGTEDSTDEKSTGAQEESIQVDLAILKDEVDQFTQELPTRVPFLSSSPDSSASRFLCSSVATKSEAHRIFPFGLHSLDQDVRNDANSFAESLQADVESLCREVDSLQVARYVNYAVSFAFPNILVPWVPFQDYLNQLAGWIFFARNIRTATTSYLFSVKTALLGDLRSEMLLSQQLTRIQFSAVERELSTLRREQDQERGERARNLMEIRKELDSITDQLRAYRANPGTEISTAKLEDIASSLAHITSFMENGERRENDDLRTLDRLRHVALGIQRAVTFESPADASQM